MTTPYKVIFAGTPEFSVPALRALHESPHQVVAVYTQPDRPAGRGRKLQQSAVKQFAEQAGYPVLQPASLKNEEAVQQLASFDADVMVVVAYGLLLPQAVLDTPRLGCLNIHASLLPRWRGAAPIQRAVLSGDQETGTTIMQMNAGLDTGDILLQAALRIQDDDTSASLHDKLSEQGADLLIKTLTELEGSSIDAQVQDESLSCYAPKLDKAEALIDWNASAAQIDRQIRAFIPWPIATTYWEDKAIRVWRACVNPQAASRSPGQVVAASKQAITVATGDGCLDLLEIQLPGKKAVAVSDFLNAHTLNAGDQFNATAPV